MHTLTLGPQGSADLISRKKHPLPQVLLELFKGICGLQI